MFVRLLHLGKFCIKIWLPLQMYFPFPVSGKIFLRSVLFFSTFWSVVPIKCHAVIPYWITNMYSLMPITVIVLLCVNTAETVCDSLCLLGCPPDWAVGVIYIIMPGNHLWHVPSLARVWYIINNQLCHDQLCFFFVRLKQSVSHMCHVPCPSHSSWFHHPNDISWRVKIINLVVP